MRSLRVLVVDDELLARRRLARLLEAMPDVELAGECEDGDEVAACLRAETIDVILVDVRMPRLGGLDLARLLPARGPAVIYCTAYAEHAVAAFDVGAADYLVKPIEASRLRRALERARAVLEPDAPARLAVPTRHGIVLVDPADVSAAVLDGELVTLRTRQGPLLCDETLQTLERRLGSRFERVHRQALVNLDKVTRLDPLPSGGFAARLDDGGVVEVSRQAARRLRRRLALR
jgi:two-component system, LytTR family, response regulator